MVYMNLCTKRFNIFPYKERKILISRDILQAKIQTFVRLCLLFLIRALLHRLTIWMYHADPQLNFKFLQRRKRPPKFCFSQNKVWTKKI